MILSIDASGQTASVAITQMHTYPARGDRNEASAQCVTVGEFSVSAPARHSEILLPMLDALFVYTGLSMDDISAVACVNGPGSFTGLRIGAATAMGLARGAGKGIVPVPTLDSLAYNIGTPFDGFIMPMLDARRGQVYTALYKQNENGLPLRVSEYMALPVLDALRYTGDADTLFLGDGASAYEADICEQYPKAHFAPPNNNRQRAASAGLCACQMLRGGFTPQSMVDLLYIRKPQAEREREARCSL